MFYDQDASINLNAKKDTQVDSQQLHL